MLLINMRLKKCVINLFPKKQPFMLKYFLDRYRINEFRDKVSDAFLPTLHDIVTFFSDGMGLNTIDMKHVRKG